MIYGGLDLSLTSTGWAVIDDAGELIRCGRIRTSSAAPRGRRFSHVATGVVEAMVGVELVARERIFSGGAGGDEKLMAMFGVHAVVEMLMWGAGRDEIPAVSPTTLLKIATGNGKPRKGSKVEVQAAAVARWGDVADQSDIADACWVAEWARLEHQVGRWS